MIIFIIVLMLIMDIDKKRKVVNERTSLWYMEKMCFTNQDMTSFPLVHEKQTSLKWKHSVLKHILAVHWINKEHSKMA